MGVVWQADSLQKCRKAIESVGWLTLAGCGWILVSSWLGVTRPFVTVAVQAFGVVLLGAAWPVLLSGLVMRRRALSVVAGVFSLLHLGVVMPLVSADSVPRWAASAPTISVAAANVLYVNERMNEGAATIAAIDADVIVLVELTPAWVDALRTAGVFDRFPYDVLVPVSGSATGSCILSRLPVLAEHVDQTAGRNVHSIEVAVGNERVQIVELHPQAPDGTSMVPAWNNQIRQHGAIVDTRNGPMVMVGDLNASYLHPPFRSLLSHGLRDAHELTGNAWKPSFPVDGGDIPPVVRIDHALVTKEISVLSVDEVTIPGSDHRGFITKLAVHQSQ